MPNGGGPRAAREISWRSPDTRIIALSAHDDPRSVDDMLASGATSYLVKDASLEEIVDAIARVGRRATSSLSGSVTEHVVSELGQPPGAGAGVAEERRDKRERIRRVIEGTSQLVIAYQPIVELASGKIVGLEALARFPGEPRRPPDVWFDEAVEVGLGAQLEATAVRLRVAGTRPHAARRLLEHQHRSAGRELPRDSSTSSKRWPAERIVIELTEHAPSSDYQGLRDALDPLRRSGSRIAVDDAGAGFSSLRHILELAPDIIKLDIEHRAEHRHGTVASSTRLRIGRVRERDPMHPDRGGRRNDAEALARCPRSASRSSRAFRCAARASSRTGSRCRSPTMRSEAEGGG